HRRTGSQQLAEHLPRYPGRPQVRRVAPFAGGAASEQAGAVTDERDAQLGVPRGGERGRKAGPVVAEYLAALRTAHLDVRQFGPQRIDRGRHLDARAEFRVPRPTRLSGPSPRGTFPVSVAKASVSGSSTSRPAASARPAAASKSAATRWVITRNATAQ